MYWNIYINFLFLHNSVATVTHINRTHFVTLPGDIDYVRGDRFVIFLMVKNH